MPSSNSTDIVISNSRGSRWSIGQIDAPAISGGFDGNYCDAIEAAIADLSTGSFPEVEAIRFKPPSCIPPDGSALDEEGAPWMVSDCEVNYYDLIALNQTDSKNWSAKFWGMNWPGTVWVYRSISLDKSIRLRRSLTLDFLQNTVTLASDCSFISAGQGMDGCWGAHVKNVRVVPYSRYIEDEGYQLQTQSIIRLNCLAGLAYTGPEGPATFDQGGIVEHCTFENVLMDDFEVMGPPLTLGEIPRHDGIHIFNCGARLLPSSGKGEGVLTFAGYSQYNVFRNVYIKRVRHGIVFEKATWNAGYDNGNIFQNIHVDDFKYAIEFKLPIVGVATERDVDENTDGKWPGIQFCAGNTFSHLRAYPSQRSAGGFHAIYGYSRLDHVAVVASIGQADVESFPEYTARGQKLLGTQADTGSTYLCAHEIHYPELITAEPRIKVDSPILGEEDRPRPLGVCHELEESDYYLYRRFQI